MPRFVGQAMLGRDITVFGDGKQIRAFTHVRDMVSGIVAAMRKGKSGEVYNLGNAANRCSILELANEVREITRSKSRITFHDPKTIYGPFYEEANNKFPDDTKTISELAWQPSRSRDSAIEDTYKYFNGLPPSLQFHLWGF
jgi:nucleoside-diphosphate-sugar epimerase